MKAAECRPGNRAVVHHIIVFVEPPKDISREIAAGGHLAGFAPGTRPHVLPEGMRQVRAGRLEAGLPDALHAQRHGAEGPQLGGRQVRRSQERRRGAWRRWRPATRQFAIPPRRRQLRGRGESDVRQRRDAADRCSRTCTCAASRSATRRSIPTASKETLLDVPRYDFNWQNSYIFSRAAKLPKGTKLHCTAHFDNSENNLANPDPKATVRWGDQTWEEMMIGWFDMAVPVEASLASAVPERLDEQRRREEQRQGQQPDDGQRKAESDAPSDGE